MDEPPLVVVLAGPNGAGKSSAASSLLPHELEFVNADDVARELPGYPSRAADVVAARIVLTKLDHLARNRSSIAIETTLSGRTLAARIAGLRREGYWFRLIFLWLSSAEMAIERVASRVGMGGHDIPTEVIRRRHQAGLRNLFDLYMPLADLWEIHDNTDIQGPRLVAWGSNSQPMTVTDPRVWDRISRTKRDV